MLIGTITSVTAITIITSHFYLKRTQYIERDSAGKITYYVEVFGFGWF